MFEIWVVMLFYAFALCILIWYFGNVLTWAVGVPLEPWYPFTIKFWIPGSQGSIRMMEPRAPDGYHFQQYPPGEAAVTVSKLEYERKEKHILRDTNFKAYNGEILGIVAPNGSGKTSLCNILTGYALQNAGQVTVLGYDMALQTALARQHVAYVQQSDVLFSDLTVHEHLLFFGSLKDETRAVLDEQITRLRNMLKLEETMSTLCMNLNQSQRKILSLAAALVTCPKVLVMDEPMVNMHPATSNVAWEALTSLKSSMCIIATTANVYEVDTRADRLLFLGYAAHKCYGTTSFIQRRYGWGYSVRVVKSAQFRGRDVVSNIRETIPEAHVLQDHVNFASIGLGARPEYTAVAAVLNTLESQQKNLGIVSFTISFVTMEDIFFRIILEMDAADVEFKKRMALGRKGVAGEDPTDYSMANLTVVTENQGGIVREEEKYESSIKIQEHVRALYDLRPQQPGLVQLFLAMITKRRHYTWQTLALPLLCWIVPTCILAVSVKFETTEGNHVAVRFSPDHLIYNLDVFDRSEPVFVSFDEASKAIAEGGYKYYVRSRNVDVSKTEMATFLEEERRNRAGRGTFVFGAQFTAQANDTTAVGKAVAWYEGDAFHSQSLSLNVLSTVLLRRVTNDSSARVRTVLRPVKKGNTFIISRHLENAKHAEELGDLLSSRLMKLLLLPAAISVVTASFVLFPIDDRVSRSQLMQFVSGTPTFIYWLSNYAWDLLMSLIGLLCLLFPVFFFFHNVQSAVGMAVLIYVSYIHSMLPFVYFYSLVTDSMITGFLMVNFLTCFLGIATTVGYQQYVIALDRDGEMISEEQSRDALLWLLYLFPPFSGSWALVKTLQLGVENAYCTHAVDPATIFDVCAFVRNSADDAAYMLTGLRYCCATYYRSNYTAVHTLSPGSFHRDGAITEIVVMLIEGVVCLLLLVLCEEARTQRWFSRPHPAGDLSALTSEHPDVKEERHHVDKVLKSQDLTKPSLLVVDLKKVYEGQVGVRGVTFHVEPGETFAVMGMQGCGKSTLLGVLSGITAATGGDAYIGATSLRDVARWGKCIGLCPDYDSFLGQLTVRQTLMLYAHVRGVRGPDRVTLVDHIFSLLSLTSVADYTVDSCRASDRRKLAVAVAIVGMPPVLLMDDPATGLDVFAKRTIYKTVNHLRRLNKSAVLLVTTSLCDAVIMSDRMSIMVDGRLRCIGTLEELRATFCRGFVIRIKLKLDAYGKPAARTAVDGSVKAAFPTAVFSGQLARFVEYWVDRMPPWREVARILDDLKTRLQEFSDAVLLSEVTLEHVLLKTAKYQDAPIKTSVVSL
ncbi:phospholipid-transporting ATPase ABCA3-like [Haemaphysalis longicornis]